MNRGQVHALEAVVGGLLLLTSVAFALQITAVTPLSASTSSQHIENQQQSSAEGVLAGAAANGEIERAILAWNESDESFYNTTSRQYYTSRAPPNAFGERLERAFGQNGIAYNVYLTYNASGSSATKRMVYRGAPSDNAVRTSRSVVLTDDDHLYNHTGGQRPKQLKGSKFYAEDVSPGSSVYNVVRVEVVVWRI